MTTASCGMVDDPHRFEAMASQVASIDLNADAVRGDEQTSTPTRTAAGQGLRPALAPSERPSGLRVEVMDPHALWDARDDDLRGALQTAAAEAAPRLVQAAAPIALATAEGEVRARLSQARLTVSAPRRDAPAAAGLRPALARPVGGAVAAAAASSARATIQLGAYSSPSAARSAWTAVKGGAARDALQGLSPIYEPVSVGGRALVRLKVAAPATAARAICRAARVSDPWCARRT